MSVAACDWTAPRLSADLLPPYGLVVAADCVWLEHLVQPFVATLERVAGPTSQVSVAVCLKCGDYRTGQFLVGKGCLDSIYT